MNTATVSTKERVLDSALRIFAEKGFREATVQVICDHAHANVAAVNYYFGDKEGLYDAVWRHAFKTTLATHPLPEPPLAGATPEQSLRQFIGAMVARVFDRGPAGYFARIQTREMVDPTPALEHIVRDAVLPQRKVLLRIIAALLGEGAAIADLHFCAYSVVSPCLFLAVSEPVRYQLVKRKEYEEKPPEELADFIFHFSMAGIAQVRTRRSGGVP